MISGARIRCPAVRRSPKDAPRLRRYEPRDDPRDARPSRGRRGEANTIRRRCLVKRLHLHSFPWRLVGRFTAAAFPGRHLDCPARRRGRSRGRCGEHAAAARPAAMRGPPRRPRVRILQGVRARSRRGTHPLEVVRSGRARASAAGPARAWPGRRGCPAAVPPLKVEAEPHGPARRAPNYQCIAMT